MSTNPYATPKVEQSAEPQSGMTLAAYRQGLINAAICALILLGSWLVLRWLTTVITGWSLAVSGETAFLLLLAAALLAAVFGAVRGRRQRGPLLLDCGPHPTRWLFLLNACVFAALGVIGSVPIIQNRVVSAGLGLVFSTYWIMMSSGRLSVHESGIWMWWNLIRWERIREYSWKNGRTLVFRSRGRLARFGQGAIPIPVELVDEFDQLLKKYVSESDDSAASMPLAELDTTVQYSETLELR